MATQNFQRITIWAITIALAVGSLGYYFMIILLNNQQPPVSESKSQVQAAQDNKPIPLTTDTTAYKVDGKVNKLQAFDLKVGDGAEVKVGDTIKAHYKGTIAQTGQKFDSSYDRGEPIDISLGSVIPGWQQAIPGMKVGGKRRLVIPANLAYGDKAAGPIPANSDLVFEVEVLDTKASPAAKQ